MAKKVKKGKKPAVKKKVTKKKSAAVKGTKRKGTCIQFLRDLYTRYPNISNQDALKKLLAKFSESNASVKSICTWKKMLRDEGIDIPLQVVRGEKKKTKKKAAKKKVKRRKVKR